MIVLITLTAAGTNTGPLFNLYSDTDGYVVPFESGVTKAALVAGYLSTLVPNGTTIVRVQSTGACTNYIDINVVNTTTTTTSSSTSTSSTTLTTSSTTTSAPPVSCGEYSLEGGVSGRTFNFTNCDGNPQTVVVPAGDAVGYCIQLPYSAAGATYIDPCGSSTLTFNYIGGDNIGVNGLFTFSLSNPLPANITVTSVSISQYDAGCATVLGTASSTGTTTILAGNLNASLPSTSVACSPSYVRANAITVNGINLVNGDTINIGGVTLNISISTSCTTMTCVE